MSAGFATDPIALSVVAGKPVEIKHGLGRQLAGLSMIWADDYTSWKIVDPEADTSNSVSVVFNANANVRLLLV